MNTKARSTEGKKFLTIEELEQSEKGPVWVLNNTSGSSSARILINIPKINGNGNDLVKINRTFIPMNIANQVPKRQLLESSEFRKCVNNAEISIITPEYATLLLDTPEAREEVKNLENEAQRIKSYLTGESIVDTDGESKKEILVSAKLQSLVADATRDDKTDIGILTDLKRYGNLTLDECKFVNQKLGKKERIKAFLKDRVAELRKE